MYSINILFISQAFVFGVFYPRRIFLLCQTRERNPVFSLKDLQAKLSVYFQGTQIELSIGVILGISTMAGTVQLLLFIYITPCFHSFSRAVCEAVRAESPSWAWPVQEFDEKLQ